jgi:hypothetical protein
MLKLSRTTFTFFGAATFFTGLAAGLAAGFAAVALRVVLGVLRAAAAGLRAAGVAFFVADVTMLKPPVV